MANFTRLNSVLSPFFLPIFSLVSTAESLISLPAAEIVRTTPTGRLFVKGTFSVQISQRSRSGFAVPWAIPFAVSMTLPPPTARIKSACISRAFFTPSSARESLGLGFTPPRPSHTIFSSSSSLLIFPRRPLFFALSPP